MRKFYWMSFVTLALSGWQAFSFGTRSDEFVVLLNDTDSETPTAIPNRLQESITGMCTKIPPENVTEAWASLKSFERKDGDTDGDSRDFRDQSRSDTHAFTTDPTRGCIGARITASPKCRISGTC